MPMLALIIPVSGGYPDNSLPGISGPVDPGYGQGRPLPPHIWGGGSPPHVGGGPVWRPPGYVSGGPIYPGGPVDPGFGRPGVGLPPGFWADHGPGWGGGGQLPVWGNFPRPDNSLPGQQPDGIWGGMPWPTPPIYFPPGMSVPNPPPVPEGEALGLIVTASGATWFTYKTDRPHRPDQGLPGGKPPETAQPKK